MPWSWSRTLNQTLLMVMWVRAQPALKMIEPAIILACTWLQLMSNYYFLNHTTHNLKPPTIFITPDYPQSQPPRFSELNQFPAKILQQIFVHATIPNGNFLLLKHTFSPMAVIRKPDKGMTKPWVIPQADWTITKSAKFALFIQRSTVWQISEWYSCGIR